MSNLFFRAGLFVLVGYFVSVFPSAADQATLTCATNLAAQYGNYTYGTGSNRIDCVHFVLKVAECRLGGKLSPDVRKAVLIAHGWSDGVTDQIAAVGTNAQLAGIQYALTSVTNLGTVIQPTAAKAGDFVQYWRQSGNHWQGHSAVITAVRNGRFATILGAHASMNRVAELDKPLDLLGTNRLVYVVRIGD